MKTRHPDIDIAHVTDASAFDGLRKRHGCSLWRYVIDGAHVGPQFATRAEALAYLDTYAREYGDLPSDLDELYGR